MTLRTHGLWIRPVLVLAVFLVVLLAGGAQPPLVQLGMIADAVFAAVPALAWWPGGRDWTCCCRCRCPS